MKKITLLLSAIGLFATACAEENTSQTSKALVEKFWNEVWNPPYNMETFDRVVAEDFIISTDGKDTKGKANFKKWLQGFQSKISDLRVTPKEMIVTNDGSRVISRLHVTGRNKGLFGTKPDLTPIDFVAISIMEVKNDKLTHNWVERSAFELYQRLRPEAEQD